MKSKGDDKESPVAAASSYIDKQEKTEGMDADQIEVSLARARVRVCESVMAV